MDETLRNVLAAFGLFALCVCFVVGVGLLLWRWLFQDDGECSARICGAQVGGKPCTHLAVPGTHLCRQHTAPAPIGAPYG